MISDACQVLSPSEGDSLMEDPIKVPLSVLKLDLSLNRDRSACNGWVKFREKALNKLGIGDLFLEIAYGIV